MSESDNTQLRRRALLLIVTFLSACGGGLEEPHEPSAMLQITIGAESFALNEPVVTHLSPSPSLASTSADFSTEDDRIIILVDLYSSGIGCAPRVIGASAFTFVDGHDYDLTGELADETGKTMLRVDLDVANSPGANEPLIMIRGVMWVEDVFGCTQ